VPPFADLQPHVLVGLRLAFYKTIAGVIPGFYFVIHIIEDELAGIGFDGQDSVAFIVFILDDRHQKRLTRKAFLRLNSAKSSQSPFPSDG
jgi:hypothetical protein